MFIRNKFIIVYRISSIRQSLRVLDLSTPTNKINIKKQYLALAKKYHPDSIQKIPQSANQSQKQRLQKLRKQFEQKFVQINKAYQYLGELSDQQINQNKDKQSSTVGSSSTTPPHTRRRTVQEQMRQQTYEYFNRRYQQQHMSSSSRGPRTKQGYYEHLQNQYAQRKRNPLPLYKVVPQFFFGLLLLAFAFGEWAYRVHQKKKKIQSGEIRQLAEGEFPEATPSRLEVFKRMSHNAMFEKQKKIREEFQ